MNKGGQINFFIVGAAKAGTSSLWRYLGQHPNIFMTKDISQKELGYFCDGYGISNEDEYFSHFKNATKEQLVGEACHAYLTSPESPSLIKRHNPNAKIVIVLRDPVFRSYSLYNWMVQYGYEWKSFARAIERERTLYQAPTAVHGKYFHSYWRNYQYLESGKYFQQVKDYLDIFGNSVLVILAEELKSDPLTATNKVLAFLGLSPFGSNEVVFTFENESRKIRSRLLNFYVSGWLRRGVRNRKLRRVLKLILKLNLTPDRPKQMTPEMIASLEEFYREDVRKLEKLIGKDLMPWLRHSK